MVDTLTHIDMTEEEYIELCVEEAKEKARRTLERDLVPFEEMVELFLPNHDSVEEFNSFYGGGKMTLKEARAYMLSNPGTKIACGYFHDEWIMFDGRRFVFEDGVEPDAWWWANAKDFDCEWYVIEEDKE